MSKQPPISVVNKPRKTTSRKSSSPRKSRKKDASPHKKKVVKKWEIPTGLYYILMGAITVVFLSAFFYFFIRPYSYRWKPCYGLKAYGVCMPAGFHIHGIDVSAKAYGFIRGAYHFYNPKTDPVRQADFFINSVKLDTGDLPPVLDIEKRGDDARTLRRDLKIWLDKIERHYKVKPILYTSYKFKTRYLNDSIFDSYPYWIAHYYVDSVEYKGNWKFWQHTDVGTLPGIREKVDLNIFNGSLEELKCMTIR